MTHGKHGLSVRDSHKLNQALNRFEQASLCLGEIGSIPPFGQDEEEQEAITAEKRRLRSNYSAARANLVRLVTRWKLGDLL